MAAEQQSVSIQEHEANPIVIIRPHTAQEEFDHLLYVINQLPFFRKNNYTVELPEHPKLQHRIDNFVNARTIDDLSTSIQKYTEQFPRE